MKKELAVWQVLLDMQLFEYFHKIIMDNDIAIAVIAGRISVDDRQGVASKISDETGSRVDDKRSTAHYQQIGICDGIYSLVDDFFIKTFFIKDDIRFDGRSACITFWDAVRIDDVVQIKEFAASCAIIAQNGTVKLVDFL